MRKRQHTYTTIQVTKEVNKHIKEFCKKYNVNASTITEAMWENFISSSLYIKQIMIMDETARQYLINASTGTTGSVTI